MIVHATPDDLAGEPWLVSAGNATALLRAASRMVDRALLTAVYGVNADGLATDTATLAVLRDATCAQAAVWAALGIDPVTGPAGDAGPTVVASKSIGSGSISYDRSGAAIAAQARAQAATNLAPETAAILAASGLLTTRVATYG